MGQDRKPKEMRGEPMGRDDIERYLRHVAELLYGEGLLGEILLVGGAYMTLVLRERETTKDVDAYFASEAEAVRLAAARVAQEEGIPPDWLNDAVKGFFYAQPTTTLWLECPGLRVYAPDPSYVFAMKALAGRPEDLRDLRILRRHLDFTTAADALEVVARYVPERLLTPRVRYLIEDIFDES